RPGVAAATGRVRPAPRSFAGLSDSRRFVEAPGFFALMAVGAWSSDEERRAPLPISSSGFAGAVPGQRRGRRGDRRACLSHLPPRGPSTDPPDREPEETTLMIGEDVMVPSSEADQLRQQLLQAQRLSSVGALASSVAHEFNNILTTIINYAKLALRPHSGDPERVQALEKILKSGQRAALI